MKYEFPIEGVEIPASVFRESLKAFKNISFKEPMQTLETRIEIIEEVKIYVNDIRKQDLEAVLKEKLLFLSYRYHLWELYVYWQGARYYEVMAIFTYEKVHSACIQFTIYKEIPRERVKKC